MKKSELKAGTVYGYQASKWNDIVPVLLLDAGRLWYENRPIFRSGAGCTWQIDERATRFVSAPNWSKYGDTGYLVVTVHGRYSEPEALSALHERMRELASEIPGDEVTPEWVNELQRRFDEEKDDSDVNARFCLEAVNNRHIIGPWEEAKSADEERREAERLKYEAERVALVEVYRKRDLLIDAASKRGVDLFLDVTDSKDVSVSLEGMAKLLGVDLNEGNQK